MIEEFNQLGIYPKPAPAEQQLICPKCSHKRKKKTAKVLSVNIEKGVYCCHHCGWTGNVKFKPKKEYIKPPDVKTDISPRMISWFNKRGISEATISHWKIGESTEYFPQISKNRKAINFKYYRDSELINIKFRDAEKNFKMVSNAELLFYGIDHIKEMEKIYIV